MRNQTLLLCVSGIVLLMIVAAMATGGPPRRYSPPPTSGLGISGEASRDTPLPRTAPLPANTDTVAWARANADRADIPERTLRAYANAEIAQRRSNPGCGLSWVTLAGIGSVESNHATYRGADLDDAGRVDPPIIGIALDGSGGTAAIGDSDGGRLDGDSGGDRAVGPMQFLPSTWATYGADGNGDGVRDPQQIDDAVLGAAKYLCSGGRDTTSGSGWWSGVLAYNASEDYAREVWTAADSYATGGRPVES
ncbi:MAG: lytic murein transglycosylase [Pseudonocardia sediminis]